MGDYASCYLTEPLWNYLAFVFLVFAANVFVGLFSIRHIYCCLRKPCYSLSFVIFLLVWCFMWVVLATAGFLVWFDYCGWYGHTWQLSLFVVLAVLTPLWFWCMFWSNTRQGALFIALVLFLLSIAVTIVFFMIDVCAGAAMLLYTVWLLYITWWSWKVSCLNRGFCYIIETSCRYIEALPSKHCCKDPTYAPIPPKAQCYAQQTSHHTHHAHQSHQSHQSHQPHQHCTCPNTCFVHQTINASGPAPAAPSAMAVQPHSMAAASIDPRRIHV